MNASRRMFACAAIAITVAGLSACKDSSDEGGSEDQVLTILAASSLTESFDHLAAQFEADHAGTAVALSYGSSSTLATQLLDGAPADVIATASPGSMEPVTEAGLLATDPVTFATNTAAVAAPQDNPANLHDLADLESSDVKVAVCVDTAPCGSVAQQLFDAVDLDVTPVTEEVDVKSVLGKVITGEVDAGVVYTTDVRAAGSEVTEIPLPADIEVSTDYVIGEVGDASRPELAADFVELVTSPDGQQALEEAGFVFQ